MELPTLISTYSSASGNNRNSTKKIRIDGPWRKISFLSSVDGGMTGLIQPER
jgi:hypothetical protein